MGSSSSLFLIRDDATLSSSDVMTNASGFEVEVRKRSAAAAGDMLENVSGCIRGSFCSDGDRSAEAVAVRWTMSSEAKT